MNQNNEDRQLSIFEIDANDDETDVVFLEQAYAYHQQLVVEENRLPLTLNLINRDREGAEERLMADYFNDHCSIDCMHWEWKNCPVSWHGQYGRGDKKYPTIMLEVVASQDLWIWHAFFRPPVLPYVVNGVGYEKGYYLADGIYPQWATFVKSFTVANDAKHAYFKKRQEGARKDVERAFGVLQGRWGIIQQPTRSYHVNTIRRVMYSCIILHNMILKDQKMAVFDWNEVYANPSRNMQRTWIERLMLLRCHRSLHCRYTWRATIRWIRDDVDDERYGHVPITCVYNCITFGCNLAKSLSIYVLPGQSTNFTTISNASAFPTLDANAGDDELVGREEHSGGVSGTPTAIARKKMRNVSYALVIINRTKAIKKMVRVVRIDTIGSADAELKEDRLKDDRFYGFSMPGAHDKEGTRADVSVSDWSANDWSASEGTRILYADQSGADTSALVSPYHVPLGHMLEKPLC
ncbi:ALP1-like protein isoform X1 [Tanacetum coccineum]